MAEAVSAVRFDISAETTKLQEGVRKANAILRQLQGSTSGIEGAFTRLGNMVAGAFAVGSIVNFIGHAIEAGAKIDDLADQAGLSAEKFQELSFALRNSGVDQEKLSVAFATFGRNLSDLNRGTGPLLDFTRRFAPALGEQLKGVTDISEAFKILVGFTSQLTDKTDQLRVTQVAMGRQGAKLAVEAANLGSSLSALMQVARETGRVMSSEQVHDLEVASQAWKDFGNLVTIQTGKVLAAISRGLKLDTSHLTPIQQVERALADLEHRMRSGISATAEAQKKYDELSKTLQQLRSAADEARESEGRGPSLPAAGPAADPLSNFDRIKAAQANLQLLQARLQAIPPATFQMGEAFRVAFGQAAAVIQMTADKEQQGAMIAATAANMRQQAYQAYTAALGASLPLHEQYLQKVAQINLAIADQGMKQLALNQAQLDYQLGLLNLATSMGAVISPMEQYRLKLEQINQTIRANPELANRAAGAQTKAAATMVASYAGAASEIAGNLSQMFQKNKGLAAAAAIISGLAGAARAIEIYGPTPWGWALAASAAALGVANAAKIMSQSESGGGAPSAGGGAAPTAPETQQPSQALQISLPAGRYTHEEVMQIIEGINDRVQNGATLISTQVR